MGSQVRGRTLGIVCLGHTGSELARLVAPFARRPLAYSPHADVEQARTLEVRIAPLDEVMTECDFLLLKPGAYLINVGRGELVDQWALTEALSDRRIAGAALDVFAVEPLPSGDPLLALDNVIVTPHWSASTSDVWLATGEAMAQGMLRASRGEVPENLVNPEVLERSSFREKLTRLRKNV